MATVQRTVTWTSFDGTVTSITTNPHPYPGGEADCEREALAFATSYGWTPPRWWQWWRWGDQPKKLCTAKRRPAKIRAVLSTTDKGE